MKRTYTQFVVPRFFKAFVFFAIASIPMISAFSQEVLLSTSENYYDFLSLDGYIDRPHLNYRTLSDSTWNMGDESSTIWDRSILGNTRNLNDLIKLRIYGPELFTSYNTSEPYGQNDGVLWQGRGFNSSLNAGARLEAYGFEVTIKPEVVFSQNLSFSLVPPSYLGSGYEGKADTYGYYGVTSIDAPQRFGDAPFFDFSWGDSEIRYTWKTVTCGFGTQSIWLGPAKINPIIHSNNAAPYPKLDIGLRPTEVMLPILGWYLGDIEMRAWWGYLSESDYFDNIDSNDHNLITGFSASYKPPLINNLTLGLHRTMLSKWESYDYSGILALMWPFMDIGAGTDERDQRASLSASYLISKVGLELYIEWGRNDFSASKDTILRYPFHTQGYTIGGQKSIHFGNSIFSGRLLIEFTNLESSRDYELIPWNTTFYAHHIITQGYTNEGQWLGAGIGTGGNSQYAGFELFYPRGSSRLFVQRVNPNIDYVWFYTTDESDTEAKAADESRFRTDLSIGITGNWFATKNINLKYGLVFTDSRNYDYESNAVSIHRYNVNFQTAVVFSF